MTTYLGNRGVGKLIKIERPFYCLFFSVWLFFSIIYLQVESEENDSSAFDELGRWREKIDFISEENVAVSEKQRKRVKSVNEQLPEKRAQYATRGIKHSYCEPEVPDDDHYICE